MTEAIPSDLSSRHADLGLSVENAEFPGESRVRVVAAHALELLRRLQGAEEFPWVRLVDLTAIDYGESPGRFEVVYRLDSADRGNPLRVHVSVGEAEANGASQPAVDSVVSLWPMAGWLEREVFDLFGIHFRGHAELRRLLLPADFEGAPLRKDFPRAGGPSEPSSDYASTSAPAAAEESR